MKSRRVHRAKQARRQALDAVETYRMSSRGLSRVFQSILPAEDPPAGIAASRAAHHLAEVEARLPRIREAIRSCRYPGAENGDPAALVWGLWGQLSETLLHVRGALQSLEVLGQRYRYREEAAAIAQIRSASRKATRAPARTRARAAKGGGKRARKRPAKGRAGRRRRSGS
jgi:hypothetical protein